MSKPNPQFAAASAKPIDLVEAVRRYRANGVQLRRLVQVRPTRNAGATERAIAWRTADNNGVELALLLADQRGLIGHLVEEQKLLVRLATARNLGQDRPELKIRLATIRRQIQRLLPA